MEAGGFVFVHGQVYQTGRELSVGYVPRTNPGARHSHKALTAEGAEHAESTDVLGVPGELCGERLLAIE